MRPQFSAALFCAGTMWLAPLPAMTQTAPCVQANALSVVVSGKTATAYLPNGAWQIAQTGIRVVPLEGGGAPSSIATPGIVDSCASNSITSQTVCTATDSDVYLISGTSLSATLQSSTNGSISFTGGSCGNCGVAINALSNIAYIGEAVNSVPGLQALNLNDNTFGAPITLSNGISESILVDPQRNEILSPTEADIYDIIKVNAVTGQPAQEYGNSAIGAEYDSSAEDCQTGFMIGTDEFTGNLFLANGAQAQFNKKDHTWSDKTEQLVDFPQFAVLSGTGTGAAGACGVEVAPGTHYATVVGEFGGNVAGFMQLPPKVSLKKAALQDFVIATLPNDPAGNTFAYGLDPHSVATYTSLKSGKAYAVIGDWGSGSPDYLAVIDIAAILAAPRVTGGYTNGKHVVDPTYNLITKGVLTYVQTY